MIQPSFLMNLVYIVIFVIQMTESTRRIEYLGQIQKRRERKYRKYGLIKDGFDIKGHEIRLQRMMRRKRRQKRRQMRQQRTRRNEFISNGFKSYHNRRKFPFLDQISKQNLKRKRLDNKRNSLGDKYRLPTNLNYGSTYKPYRKQLTPNRLKYNDMKRQPTGKMQNYHDEDSKSQSLIESRFILPYTRQNFDNQKYVTLPFIRKRPTERQGTFLAASPITYGLAWFGSMIGLASMMRQPISEVFTNFDPASLLNGTDPLVVGCIDSVDGHCPIDCTYNEWNEWSSCTVTCGGGIKIRSRTIKTHPLYGGKECDGKNSLDDVQTSTEKTECNTQICPPVNCEWEPWSSWSTCSNTCGTGTRNRIRRIRLHEENGGTCTGDSLETTQENCGACPPVNCVWENWSSWSSCSITCGTGTITRVRGISIHEEYGGTSCTGSRIETSQVNCGTCPSVNCEWNTWSPWSSCPITCGSGRKVRVRGILTHEEHGGAACTGDKIESATANCGSCPAVSCSWESWSSWSLCSITCGTGIRIRTRRISVHESNGGAACTEEAIQSESVDCGLCDNPPGCSCEGYEFLGVSGCRISPNDPPSPGYKCLCRNYLVDCAGEEVKCGSATDTGCNGCSDRECCSDDAYNGDCNGYNNK